MSTFNTIARRVIAEAGLSEYGITPEFILDSWLKSRYKEVLDSVSFGSVNTQFRSRFTTRPLYNTGTVAVTFGSDTVVGTGTAWDASFVGRQFRATMDPHWYLINAVADATHLTLESNWPVGTSSGLAYEIVQNYYELASEVKWIIGLLVSGVEIPNTPQESLNTVSPLREAAAAMPTQWSTPAWGVNTGNRIIELYPAPDILYLVDVIGYVNVLEPSLTTVPINEIDERMLSSGVLSDAFMYRASRQLDVNLATISVKLSNEHEVRYRGLLDNLKRRDAMWVI